VKSEGDSEEDAIQNAVSVYSRSLGEQSGIYRGTEYTGYPHRIQTGHPFFESSDLTYGTVFYDGMLYKSVPMWYDLVKNQVVIQYIDRFSKISLHNERIAYFSLYNHHYIHINKDTSNRTSLSEGFYDRIYHGKTEVLVKRSKNTLKEVSTEGIFITILKQKNDFYLRKGELYYAVESPGSVLKALGSKQKEIQEFLKKSNVKFRKDPENAIVRIVRYYDLLTELK
jgi:hypothetical protein